MANNETFEESLHTLRKTFEEELDEVRRYISLVRVTHDRMQPELRIPSGVEVVLDAYTAHEQTLLAAIAAQQAAQHVSNMLRSWAIAAATNRHTAFTLPPGARDNALRYVPSADTIRAALTLMMEEPKHQPCIATLECKDNCRCRVECGCEKCKHLTSAAQEVAQ